MYKTLEHPPLPSRSPAGGGEDEAEAAEKRMDNGMPLWRTSCADTELLQSLRSTPEHFVKALRKGLRRLERG